MLPLRNVSGDASQEYFADGMTEAIISDLARIKALRVISRTSAMQYKGSTLSLPQIARELNVDAVLEGSALLVGNRVRVSVQLVAARSDETLWADRYDRDLGDVLGLQSDLAATVAREIAVQLTPAEATQLARRAAVNPEAHLEVLKSRHTLIAATKEALELGLRHARRALELDPEYALAWSALADCQALRALRGMAPPAEAGAEAAAAARRALELDPSLADAWTSLGMIAAHSGDVAGGMRALQKAIELNPSLAMAHNLLARTLYAFERHEQALEAANLSVKLDPLSTLIRTTVGDAYYFAREYDKSVFHYRMSIELDPRFDGAHTDMARTLEALGRFDEARAEYEEGRRLSGGIAGPSFGLAHLEAAAGNEAEARRILAELTAARAHQGHLGVGHRRAACQPGRRGRGLQVAGDCDRGEGVRPDPAAGPSAARSDPHGPALLANGGANGADRLGAGYVTTPERLAVALADRYRIERELGQGGMATVFLAHDLKHQRDVAIKVLHPELGAALGAITTVAASLASPMTYHRDTCGCATTSRSRVRHPRSMSSAC